LPGRPGWLVVSCRGAEWKLPLLGVDLYPELPGLAEPVGRIDPFDLAAGLERVLVAAGEPEEPPMLGGVCLHSQGETLTLATTDRYRVAVTQIPWTPEAGEDGLRALPDTLIPAEVLSTALTVARRTVPSKKDARDPDIGGTIWLHLGAHGVALVGPTHVVTGRVIDGQRGAASTWRKIAWAIKEPSTLVTVRTAELRQAVRDVSLVLDPKEAIVCEFFDHGGITLSPTVEGKGRVVVSLDAESTTGPSYEAQVESRFLLDVLGTMKSEFTTLSFLARPFAPFQVNPDHADGTLDQTYWQVIAQKRGAAAVGAP
jgi:DNA polymerase-3 subunit beta